VKQSRWASRLFRLPPLLVLGYTLLAFSRLQYPLPETAAGLLWLTRLDPLPALVQLGREFQFQTWMLLPLLVAVLTGLLGRVFCGWLCPLGGLLNLLELLPWRNRLPGRERIAYWLRRGRLSWGALLLGALLAGGGWPLLLSPWMLLTQQLRALAEGTVPWLLILLLGVGVLIFPRAWCSYLCPSGLLFSGIARWRRWRLRLGESCIDCGRCWRRCPTASIDSARLVVDESCIVCGRCWEECPVAAINWGAGNELPADQPGGIKTDRRLWLAGAGMVAVGFLWGGGGRTEQRYLRPPGARPETEFLAFCSRCQRCIQACPSGTLQPLPWSAGLGGFDTPRVVPRTARCELCGVCQEVCPSGAIQTVALTAVRIGTARVEPQLCLGWSQGILCLLCMEQCPLQAISDIGGHRPQVDPRRCVGCGACENGCPVEEPAIRVFPV